jgi:hypothetical protein
MPGIVPEKWSTRKVDIVTGSGMLCVTIHPRRDWLAGLGALAADAVFVAILYQLWSRMPFTVRLIWIFILIFGSLSTVYEYLCDEILEFDSQKLTIRQGVHGWERKREYPIEQCSDLEWCQGRKGGSYLAFRAGKHSIKFGKRLPEDTANEILIALQRALPDVAQKIAPPPGTENISSLLGLANNKIINPCDSW